MSDRYTVEGHFDGWDIFGEGETMQAALLAYAAECRRDVASQERLIERVLDDAHRAEKAAAVLAEIES